MSTKKASTRTELRIVDQVRTMHLRGYDFACEGVKLRLEISPVSNDEPNLWRVQARTRTTPSAGLETSANETAPTPTEALRAVAKSWRENEAQHGITVFDWEAIEALLVSVHAL
jgi:hypothetical protein